MCLVERHSLQWARWLSDGNAKWTHSKKQDRARSPHFVFAKELKLAEGESQEIPESFQRPRANRRRICLKTHNERSICSNKRSATVSLWDHDICTISIGSKWPLHFRHKHATIYSSPVKNGRQVIRCSQKL